MYARGHLLTVVPIYVLAVRYLSDPATVLSPFFVLYLFTAMVGALFPDIDWLIMRHVYEGFGHRNPITHSAIIPLTLAILFRLYHLPTYTGIFMSGIPYSIALEDVQLSLLNAFVLGIASHLLADHVKTGKLVWFHKDKYWYVLQGAFTIGILFFTGFFRWFT